MKPFSCTMEKNSLDAKGGDPVTYLAHITATRMGGRFVPFAGRVPLCLRLMILET
jgi:hypothetical protein